MRNLFGDYVKSHREKLDQTLKEIADQLKITPGYLSDIENGRRPAPINDKLQSMADVLKIEDRILFLDLAAKSRTNSRNGIPADIYNYIKDNPDSWPQLRKLIIDQVI